MRNTRLCMRELLNKSYVAVTDVFYDLPLTLLTPNSSHAPIGSFCTEQSWVALFIYHMYEMLLNWESRIWGRGLKIVCRFSTKYRKCCEFARIQNIGRSNRKRITLRINSKAFGLLLQGRHWRLTTPLEYRSYIIYKFCMDRPNSLDYQFGNECKITKPP